MAMATGEGRGDGAEPVAGSEWPQPMWVSAARFQLPVSQKALPVLSSVSREEGCGRPGAGPAAAAPAGPESREL